MINLLPLQPTIAPDNVRYVAATIAAANYHSDHFVRSRRLHFARENVRVREWDGSRIRPNHRRMSGSIGTNQVIWRVRLPAGPS
jgi:hypothetical protein